MNEHFMENSIELYCSTKYCTVCGHSKVHKIIFTLKFLGYSYGIYVCTHKHMYNYII